MYIDTQWPTEKHWILVAIDLVYSPKVEIFCNMGKYLIIENVYICILWDLRRKSVPSQDQKVQRYMNQLRSRLINFLLIVL